MCAHYDAMAERRDTLADLLNKDPSAFPAFGIEEGVALFFKDEGFSEAYSIRPNENFTCSGARMAASHTKACLPRR